MKSKRYSMQDKANFAKLCGEYHKVEKDSTRFILLSLQLHSAKANVPKSMWRLLRERK